jgi:hypothetical protein
MLKKKKERDNMKTIPDLITDIRWYYKRTIDVPLRWMESIGSKMNSYAWNKRWRNREEGTGYGKRPR